MAKLDYEALQFFKELKHQRDAENSRGLEIYHSLAAINFELKTLEDKKKLIDEVPFIAAQIVYYLNNAQLGDLFVKKYSADRNAELRQLAFGVRDVLEARRDSNEALLTF